MSPRKPKSKKPKKGRRLIVASVEIETKHTVKEVRATILDEKRLPGKVRQVQVNRVREGA